MTPQPPKFLLSYWFGRKLDLDQLVDGMPTKPMLFADSGAYSAWTRGATIDRKDYAAWLKRWAHLITTAVNLDVIRDVDATHANQTYLERSGCNVIPVFHTGTPMTVLDHLAKTYPYIGLGGMVGSPVSVNHRWAATCMQRTQDQGTVFHGFGMTHPKVLQSLRWHSADSTTWCNGHRFGLMPLWNGKKFAQVKVGKPESVYPHAKHIRRLGFDPACIADSAKYKREYSIQIAAASWHAYEQQLRQRHGAISCPDKVDGMHIYLVGTLFGDMQLAAKAIGRQHD